MTARIHVERAYQKHWTGCAIACIATLVCRSYDEVAIRALGRSVYRDLNRLSYSSRRRDFALTTPQMMKTIRSYGYRVVQRYDFDFKRHAILTCDNYDGSYHCVVWDPMFGGRIIDPGGKNDPTHYYIDAWESTDRDTLIVSAA